MMPEVKSAADIDAAIRLVLELAFQNTTDRFDNPERFNRELAAIKLVERTFTKSGELTW